MIIEFDNPEFERLAFDGGYVGKWEPRVVKKYRRVIIYMQMASNRQSLSNWKGLHFERLTGKRKRVRRKIWPTEYSVRLSGKWRLVFTIKDSGEFEIILILTIEDYH